MKNKKVDMNNQSTASLLAKLHALIEAADKTLPGHSLEEAESMCSVINDNSPMDFGDFNIKDATLKTVAEIYDKDDRETDPEYEGRQPTEFLSRYFIEVTVEDKSSVKRILLSEFRNRYEIKMTEVIKRMVEISKNPDKIMKKHFVTFNRKDAEVLRDRYVGISNVIESNGKYVNIYNPLIVSTVKEYVKDNPNQLSGFKKEQLDDVVLVLEWTEFKGDIGNGQVNEASLQSYLVSEFGDEIGDFLDNQLTGMDMLQIEHPSIYENMPTKEMLWDMYFTTRMKNGTVRQD